MKRRSSNWHHRNTKDCKKIFWTIVCQQIGQSGWNGYISRNMKSYITESERNQKIWIEQLQLMKLKMKIGTTVIA